MVVIGLVFMGLGVLSAGIALFTEEWRPGVTGTQAAIERALVVGGLLLSGFLAGSPFVVFGQLLEIFLDQRILLTRIHRRLRRPGEPPRREEPPHREGDRYPKLG